MSEASASAMLVGTPEMLDERPGAVTTTLPRSEIEEALAADPPADLVLEILRAIDGGTETEKRTLRSSGTGPTSSRSCPRPNAGDHLLLRAIGDRACPRRARRGGPRPP